MLLCDASILNFKVLGIYDRYNYSEERNQALFKLANLLDLIIKTLQLKLGTNKAI